MADLNSKPPNAIPDPVPVVVCAIIGITVGLLAKFDPLWHFIVGWGLLFAALGAVLRFAMMLADRGNRPHHLKALPQFMFLHGIIALLLLGFGRLIRWPWQAGNWLGDRVSGNDFRLNRTPRISACGPPWRTESCIWPNQGPPARGFGQSFSR